MQIGIFKIGHTNRYSLEFRLTILKKVFNKIDFSISNLRNKKELNKPNISPLSIYFVGGETHNSKGLINEICESNTSFKIFVIDANHPNYETLKQDISGINYFIIPYTKFLVPLSYAISSFCATRNLHYNENQPIPGERKRILLISPEGWQKVSVNLGLALLSGALKDAGFEVLILDLCYDSMPDERLIKTTRDFNPFIIGVSAKTAQAKEALRIGKLLKQNSRKATFVAGGPHVTLDPKFFFTIPNTVFDYCIMSEGEVSFTCLAVALAIDSPNLPYNIDGIAYQNKQTSDITVNKWSVPSNISILPYPDFKSLNNLKLNTFCYPVVSSRGCPYNCIYCCVNLLTGSKKWRSRTPENIIDELLHAHKTYGISQFEFWDDNFTLDMKRAKNFCQLLIETGVHFSWWCHNGIRADKIDSELASLMHKAGCTSVAIGIESGTPEVFNSIQKGEKLSDCVNAVKTLKKSGIKAVGYFIIGLPGDTLATFIETVRFQRNLMLDHYTFGLLVPYPGTKVWDIVKDKGKFLVNVTDSQHFSSDLPTISFELPNFPPHDIVVAYYLTIFFELFEAAESILEKSGECNITLLTDQSGEPSSATGLIYSLYPLREYISISLCDVGGNVSLRSGSAFRDIAKQFDFRLSANSNGLQTELNKANIIVSSETLSHLLENRTTPKRTQKCYLQHSSSIKALIEIPSNT